MEFKTTRFAVTYIFVVEISSILYAFGGSMSVPIVRDLKFGNFKIRTK